MTSTEAKRAKLDSDTLIVTHNGTHHADEALAVHLLRKLPQYASARLQRSRDKSVIDQASIVVDVGAEYDAARHRYDHHQRGFEETFDKDHKIKLSSAGLVWKHFGQDILAAHLQISASDERVKLLRGKLYDDFVEAIDGIDNGVPLFPPSAGSPAYSSKTDLSSRIGHLNPRWNETLPSSAEEREADGMRRFEKASQLAGQEFFDRVDYTWEAWLPARKSIEDALRSRKQTEGGDAEGRLLVFDEYAAWKSHIFELEKDLSIPANEQVLYVIYPDESSKWRIQCVPESADSFISRKPLPEPWRGVRDEQLSELSGISACLFVHASGFIGGNATKQGALEMAHAALKM
ncbi:hypothetical protein CBS101457_003275 [Exobasidium rhododendri]|nr:hypothetical protein CBS101457_003275 [Exobasidium rhododendri]